MHMKRNTVTTNKRIERDGESVSDRQRVCEKCEETIVRKKINKNN